MRRLTAVAIVLSAILIAGIVWAQTTTPTAPPTMGAGAATQCPTWENGKDFAQKIIKQLNLTPDQVKSLEAIHKDFPDSTASVRQQIKTKMEQMAALWSAPQPDAAAIKDLAAQIDNLRNQVRDAAIDHAVQALAILTPAQRAQVHNWMNAKPSKMMMGMGCGICCGAGLGEEETSPATGSGPMGTQIK